MPTWSEVINKLKDPVDTLQDLQKHYLNILCQYTNRTFIAYYSAFLQKPGIAGEEINDMDKNAFMQMVAGIPKEEREKGLDLILHTPGGDIAAAESLVYYLRSIFGMDIRVIVPQMAMSAGTMIALSSKEILMGKESCLGPIDPQFGGVSCYGVVKEFNQAVEDVRRNPSSAVIWANIISKYHPTFLGDCQNAIEWGKKIVTQWLITNMFSTKENREILANHVVSELSNHETTFAHNRHIHVAEFQELGINVKELEKSPKLQKEDCVDLQDCILTLHHIYMQFLASTHVLKIVESKYDSMVINMHSS